MGKFAVAPFHGDNSSSMCKFFRHEFAGRKFIASSFRRQFIEKSIRRMNVFKITWIENRGICYYTYPKFVQQFISFIGVSQMPSLWKAVFRCSWNYFFGKTCISWTRNYSLRISGLILSIISFRHDQLFFCSNNKINA